MTPPISAEAPRRTGTGRHEPPRDHLGRYLIPTPAGEVKPYTRSTTIAETLDDQHLLRKRDCRLTAQGLGLRDDLVDLASSHDPDDDREVYNRLVDDATAAANADAAANKGTALHKMTERLDAGQAAIDQLPAKWRVHLEAYQAKLDESVFRVLPEYVELFVALDNYRIAGQIDRIVETLEPLTITFPTRQVHLPAGTFLIGDLKTGKARFLPFAHLKYAQQIAIYSNHDATWHPDPAPPNGGTRGPRVEVSRDVALLIHLDQADPDAPISFHWVDLAAGWDNVLTSIEVRERRKAAKDFIRDDDAAAINHNGIADAHRAWLKQRVAAIGAHTAAAQDLRVQWPNSLRNPDDTPARLPDDATPAQIGDLVDVLDRIEDRYELPFQPTPQPQ